MESFTNNKYIIKSTLAVLILLAVFLLAEGIGAFKKIGTIGNDAPAVNVITVAGKGEVIAVPDVAIFTIGAVEEDLTVAEAQKKATDKINSAIKFFKESGVAEKDIKTVYYNVNPKYEYPKALYYPYPEGKRTLTGYEVSQGVEVKVRKLADAGKLLSGVGELGLNNISGLTFIVDKEDELKKEAREKAIAEARSEAKKLAKDLGVKLVRIVSFNESGNYPIYFKEAFSADVGYGRGGATAPASPEVPAGENKIISNVNISYEIR